MKKGLCQPGISDCHLCPLTSTGQAHRHAAGSSHADLFIRLLDLLLRARLHDQSSPGALSSPGQITKRIKKVVPQVHNGCRIWLRNTFCLNRWWYIAARRHKSDTARRPCPFFLTPSTKGHKVMVLGFHHLAVLVHGEDWTIWASHVEKQRWKPSGRRERRGRWELFVNKHFERFVYGERNLSQIFTNKWLGLPLDSAA